jgi:hypothetical protein
MNTFKRGSTFSMTVTYVPGPSDPADLSATAVTSWVLAGNLQATSVLSVGAATIAGGSMSFTVVIASTVTATWPLGHALWDVKFVYAGVTFYAATETLMIVDNITK